MAQPADDDVQQFISIIEVPRETAIRFIQGASNNIEQAINNYLENPARYESTTAWEEDVFSQGRNGEEVGQQPPAFAIHADDVFAPSSVTPTRPPSRVDQQQQNMMGMSAMETSQQETGVIQRSPYFGPATREEYNMSQWAMTLTRPSAQEYYPDVDQPEDRARAPGEPAFLKPLPTSDFLPSLLTILFSIPLAQQALILPNMPLVEADYKQDWWQGGVIQPAQVVEVGQEPDHSLLLINETQRLMAFLKETRRKYGSVESLFELVKKSSSNSNFEGASTIEKFLTCWSFAASKQFPDLARTLYEVFHSELLLPSHISNTSISKAVLEITLDKQTSGPTASIYDALDALIWESDIDGLLPEPPWLTHASDILVMSVSQPDTSISGLNTQIPSAWFADRYLSSNSRMAQDKRKAIADVKARIIHAEQQKNSLCTFVLPESSKSANTLDLFTRLIDTFSGSKKEKEAEEAVEDPDDAAELDEKYSIGPQIVDLPLVQSLQGVLDDLHAQIRALDEEQVNLRRKIDQLSSFLKDTSTGDDPDYRYTLCGVATSLDTTYFRQPLPNHSETSADNGDAGNWQWWRAVYTPEPQIDISRTTEEEVLKAAQADSRKILLVYATDEALSELNLAIPDALEAFVQQDNKSFDSEIATSSASRNNLAVPEWSTVRADEIIPSKDEPWKPVSDSSYQSQIMNWDETKQPMSSDLPTGELSMDDRSDVAMENVENTELEAEHREFTV